MSASQELEREKAYLAATHNFKNRTARILWMICWCTLFRFSPRPFFSWRSFLLRCFGAKIGKGTHIYPAAIIWAPWNLECGRVVAIADGANVYNTSMICIGDLAVVSQGAYLCCGSHNYKSLTFDFITKPISIGREAWVAANAIVLMGVSVGQGAVIGAGSVVHSDIDDWTVVAGNPCKVLKKYERC